MQHTEHQTFAGEALLAATPTTHVTCYMLHAYITTSPYRTKPQLFIPTNTVISLGD
jgi:hypothetical protein